MSAAENKLREFQEKLEESRRAFKAAAELLKQLPPYAVKEVKARLGIPADGVQAMLDFNDGRITWEQCETRIGNAIAAAGKS